VNLSRVLVGLAVLAMLCSCSGPASTSSHTQSPSTSQSSTPSQSSSPSPCQADTDSVTPGLSPLIQILPESAARPSTITARVRLACGTTLNVTRDGSAITRFGAVAACQLMRFGGPVGTLISREPTGRLFSLTAGQIWCRDLTSQQEQASVCGTGTVYLTGITTDWDATCGSNHVFHIAVYTGSVQIHYPEAKKNVTLNPGIQLAYDPATGQAASSAFMFSAFDISIFAKLGP